MSTGNLILGLGRRSVGDLTMYRRNGKQVTRVRVRKIKNPNSNGQLFQRAMLATVLKAYAAGKAIFDHSFEGVPVGAPSMSRFQKENLNALRQAVAADINGGVLAAAGGQGVVVARGAVTPTPWKFIISRGSVVQRLFSVVPSSDANVLVAKMAAASGDAPTVAEYVAANSLAAGDIFTICAFGVLSGTGWSASAAGVYSTHYPTAFGFIRLTVKAGAVTSTTAMSTATVADLFDVESTGENIPATTTLQTLITDGIPVSDVVVDAETGSMGVIRSREDSGVRSNTEMVVPATLVWGIHSEYILDAWNPETTKLGDSSLILEGGNF